MTMKETRVNEMKLNLKMILANETDERPTDEYTIQCDACRDAKTNRRIQTHRTMRE